MSAASPPPAATPFTLDPRLESNSIPVGDLALCSVFLVNDARFPWLMLVPRRDGACEIVDLSEEDSVLLMNEVRIASAVLRALSSPDKINVGALGNMVPQLHVHVVARFHSDPAWPGPVWGNGQPNPYPAHAAAALVAHAATLFEKA